MAAVSSVQNRKQIFFIVRIVLGAGPRYPQVRQYLVKTYEEAATVRGLDGLKLDFIDSFILRGKSIEENPGGIMLPWRMVWMC